MPPRPESLPTSDYAHAMPRTARLIAGTVAVAALLTACGEEPEEIIDVGTRITTAADALECPTGSEVEEKTVSPGTGSGSEDALGAVQAWAKRARRSADIPLDGYHVRVEEVGTVLFTHDANGQADIAVIAARDRRPGRRPRLAGAVLGSVPPGGPQLLLVTRLRRVRVRRIGGEDPLVDVVDEPALGVCCSPSRR